MTAPLTKKAALLIVESTTSLLDEFSADTESSGFSEALSQQIGECCTDLEGVQARLKHSVLYHKITVTLTTCTDLVTVYTMLPPAVALSQQAMCMTFEVAQGSGIEYVNKHFGMIPNVIRAR